MPDRGEPPPAHEIREAIQAFQRGIAKEQNFYILVQRFYRPVEHFLARWAPSVQDREDITQEVFLRVYKNLKDYRGDAQFSTWLFRIAHNTCMRWLKRDPFDQIILESQAGGDEDFEQEETMFRTATLLGSQLEDLITKERSHLLRSAIESLPKQMRRCVELRIYQDLAYEQIAALLQLSTGAVKAHIFQAREKLRGRLRGAVSRGDL